MLISVAICTHNRSALLSPVVASVLKQRTLGEHRFELVIVDNASTDGTGRIAERLAHGDPRVIVASEPKLGLSHARNKAIGTSSGEVIAFLDDDAIAHESWLQAMIDPFLRDDRTVAVGGKIVLDCVAPRPMWLAGPQLEAMLSGLDLGEEALEMDQTQTPYGANMAVRRSAALAAGGFDPNLGRNGTQLLSMEEDEFFSRVRTLGSIRYTPHAVVSHVIPVERLRVGYFIRRSYWQAVSERIVHGADMKSAVRGMLSNVIRLVTEPSRLRRRRAVLAACNIAYLWGMIRPLNQGVRTLPAADSSANLSNN